MPDRLLQNGNMSAPFVSVIVCAYTENRWTEQIAAIDSLNNQTHKPDQIVMIIDHNPALFARSQTQFGDDGLTGKIPVTLIENEQERGLSGARNSGLRYVTGEIVAFMDEDAQAEPEWLERLIAHFDDPKVMGVGGAIIANWQQGRPAWFPSEFDWVVGCTYTGMSATTAPVRNLIGCNMAYRREVFTENGGFINGIGRVGTRPVGCEETELCIRARQRWPDQTFLYEPAARVHHVVPATRADWKYFRSRCFAEGISKALVAKLVGAGDGLSSERSYTVKTLPAGFFAGWGDMLRRKRGGFGRASAIVIGLLFTISGYVTGKISESRKPTVKPSAAPPIELIEPAGMSVAR